MPHRKTSPYEYKPPWKKKVFFVLLAILLGLLVGAAIVRILT